MKRLSLKRCVLATVRGRGGCICSLSKLRCEIHGGRVRLQRLPLLRLRWKLLRVLLILRILSSRVGMGTLNAPMF